MAKSKVTQVNEKLTSIFSEVQPANPAPSSTDKAYLRGLKKRGFTDNEIIQVAAKAGYKITADMLIVKPKKIAIQAE